MTEEGLLSISLGQQMVNMAERKRGRPRATENNWDPQDWQGLRNSEQLRTTKKNREQAYFPDCKSVGAAYDGSSPFSPTRIKKQASLYSLACLI